MPNIGAILKDEITRLARRSTRSQYAPLKKDVVVLKHAVAQLKRQNHKLLRDNALLMAEMNSKLAKLPSVPEAEVKKTRISPKLIKSKRKRLGLSREDFGKLLGVSSASILAWEMGRSRPREKVRAGLAAVRKLHKREARRRLEAMASVNGHRQKSVKKPARKKTRRAKASRR